MSGTRDINQIHISYYVTLPQLFIFLTAPALTCSMQDLKLQHANS